MKLRPEFMELRHYPETVGGSILRLALARRRFVRELARSLHLSRLLDFLAKRLASRGLA